jgi:hypothetical protein
MAHAMASCSRSASMVASSSSRSRASVVSRRSCVTVRAAEAFCRDMVGERKTDVQSQGKVFKLKFLASGGDFREVDCPDNMYILDAADKGGVDLPGEPNEPTTSTPVWKQTPAKR